MTRVNPFPRTIDAAILTVPQDRGLEDRSTEDPGDGGRARSSTTQPTRTTSSSRFVKKQGPVHVTKHF